MPRLLTLFFEEDFAPDFISTSQQRTDTSQQSGPNRNIAQLATSDYIMADRAVDLYWQGFMSRASPGNADRMRRCEPNRSHTPCIMMSLTGKRSKRRVRKWQGRGTSTTSMET